MTSASTTEPDLICRVCLTEEARWVSLSLSLGNLDATGRFLTVTEGISCELVGLDELSQGYTLRTWQGGVISGARYAFRALKSPPRQVRLHELSGQLGSGDIWAISSAAVVAVGRLLDQPDVPVNLGGWKMEAEVRRRRSPGDGQSGTAEAVSPRAASASNPVDLTASGSEGQP